MTAATTDIRRDDTHERLIEAAIWLLGSEPYPAVGVKAICDRAGVNKGSFYHFFKSKEDLSIAALDRSWERFRSHVIEPSLAEGNPDGLAEAIWEACTARHRSGHPRGCIFIRLAASVTDSEDRLRARLLEVFTEWAEFLGNGTADWDALAAMHGRLLHAFAIPNREPVSA